jgi:hypothetical protein
VGGPLLLLLLVLQAAPAVEAAVVAEGRDRSQVMRHLEQLTGKFGPRLTGSENLAAACAWTRERFAEYGLEARLEEWGTFPVGFNRGPASGRIVAPVEVTLEVGTMAWSAGTRGPVRGAAIPLPADDAAFEAARERLRGAWVVVPRRGRTAALQQRCEEAGAAGFVTTQGGELIVTDGNYRISWDALPKRVTVYLTGRQHALVAGLAEKLPEVTLEFDIKNEFKQGPIPLHNVIADLKGSEKPDEFVVVGGHLDSWDGARGALDNGTGVATTIEAARLLAKAGARPRRTVRFMLWSGEEQGLLGSTAWVRAHPQEVARTSAALVHDGGTNYVSGICATEPMVPIFEKVFAPIRTVDATMPFRIRTPYVSIPFSDHHAFTMAGAPGFFWDQAGHSDYNFAHHTQNDHPRLAIREYQIHSSIVIAVGAYGLANLDELLPRQGVGVPAAGPRRRLGLTLGEGAVVAFVREGSVAARAGVREGDVLLKLGDVSIAEGATLGEALQKAPAKAKLLVRREGKELALDVEFPAPAEPRRLLGIQLGEGMKVEQVQAGSVAEKAGLKTGDAVLQVGEVRVEDRDGLIRELNAGPPNKTLTVERGGAKVQIDVVFDE